MVKVKRSKRCRFEAYKDILKACRNKPLTRYSVWKVTMLSCNRVYEYVKLLERQEMLFEEVGVRGGIVTKVYSITSKGVELIESVNKINSLLGVV